MKKRLQIFKMLNELLREPYLNKLLKLKKNMKKQLKKQVANLYLLNNLY